MAPYLSHLTSTSVLPPQSDLLSRLQQRNKDELARLDAKLEDAKTNLGETEVSDVLRERATYLARIGEKVCFASLAGSCLCWKRLTNDVQDEAVKAHEEAFEKSAGKGTKIDLVLSIIRIGFFHSDHELVMSNIDRAQKCVHSSC